MLVKNNTPWEDYTLGDHTVWVKREDLCCPYPGPSFSKIRGVVAYLDAKKKELGPDLVVGVQDTMHSKAGWGVAYVCQKLGLRGIDFYPKLKIYDGKPGPAQEIAHKLGAELVQDRPLKSSVLWARSRKYMAEHYHTQVMMPNGLKLLESIEATAKELVEYTPKELIGGTWIASVSSGTLASGIWRGLAGCGFVGTLIAHLGYSRSHDQVTRDIVGKCGSNAKLVIIDEKYQYKDKVNNSWIPFPCNEYYDAKALTWLCNNVATLQQPVVFWNIGA